MGKAKFITGTFTVLRDFYFGGVIKVAGSTVELTPAHQIESINEATLEKVGKAKPTAADVAAAKEREEKAKAEAEAKAKADEEAKAKALAEKEAAEAAAKAKAEGTGNA